ncbi:hypothetical protein FXO37_30632 [Capsicum annuum]|nr:hypothetical protein FXO37_30632 [Capsicum annuum]
MATNSGVYKGKANDENAPMSMWSNFDFLKEEKLLERAKVLKVSAGTESDADLGPVISKQNCHWLRVTCVCCFLYFQDTSDLANLTKYPVKDLLVFGYAAQFESHLQVSSWLGDELIRTPCPGASFRYLTTLIAASRRDCFGACIN